MELFSKKNYFNLVFLISFCLFNAGVQAQCAQPQLPKGVVFKKPADYRAHDAVAAECLQWLLDKESFECTDQREAVNAFVLVWLSGHPDVVAEVETRVMPFIDKHPELLFPMLHGAANYMLTTREKDRTQINATVSGLKAVDSYCRSSKILRKDSEIKALHKLIRKKKVHAWVEEQRKS